MARAMSGTVLVTGADGFVGSAVVRRLVRDSAAGTLRFDDDSPVTHVVALVRPAGPLYRLRAALQTPSRCSVECADFTDSAALRGVLQRWQPRSVMHIAMHRSAYKDESDEVRRRVIDVPLEEMFSGLEGQPGTRIIFTSSAWVLPSGDRLDEDTPPQPFTVYGRNKLRGEQLLPALQARSGVDWMTLRLFNIFGRYEASYRLLPYLVDRLWQGQTATLGNADAIRDFTDVDVVAGAYVAALAASAGACGATYHVGSGRGITIREFATVVADIVGHPELICAGALETPDGKVPFQVANPERARRVLGWFVASDVLSDIRSAARWWVERRTVIT